MLRIQRCCLHYIFHIHKNRRRDTQCPPLRFGRHTPPVAATSFFAGEVEIFDFVTERVKRCIAVIVERYGFYILCNKHCFWGEELAKVFWRRYLYTIFFICSIFLYILFFYIFIFDCML